MMIKVNGNKMKLNDSIKNIKSKNINANSNEKYEERLKKIVNSPDPFWNEIIDKFIKEVFEDKEEGLEKLEKLAKNKDKFNEFTKQIFSRIN